MGCGCHAAKAANATKRQVVRSKTLNKNVVARTSYASNGMKRVIRRTVSH